MADGSIARETRWMDATAQAALVRRGEVTPLELLEAALARCERLDPALNAVVIRWADHARELAGASARPGVRGAPFRGVPTILKDLNAPYAGMPMSNGNRALRAAGWRAPANSWLVDRILGAGLVPFGRGASPEWGSVPVTESLAWGPTRNPWDLARTAGGSSGGSAAAVAAGIVPIAHASDGGGSIRIPASCCGLVGLKTSQGRISMGPLRDETVLSVQFAVTRSVRDAAALLDAVYGPGVGDSVVAPPPARPYVRELAADHGRLRIGVLDHHPLGGACDPACTEAARVAARALADLGHDVHEAWPAPLEDAGFPRRFTAMWAAQQGMSRAALAATLGREVGPDDVEPMNWAMAEAAARMSATDLGLALDQAHRFRREVRAWWAAGWDLLVTPTLAAPPLPIGTIVNDVADPLAPVRRAGEWVAFTPPYNTTGQPAISLPLHWTADGLPIGVQLVADHGREDLLISVAARMEELLPWAHRRPPLD
ncbi:MAG: amidase [Ilumatobacteraceae bacterium]